MSDGERDLKEVDRSDRRGVSRRISKYLGTDLAGRGIVGQEFIRIWCKYTKDFLGVPGASCERETGRGREGNNLIFLYVRIGEAF